MPTCRAIIHDALRQAGVIASGETPTADEAADALFAFQGMVDGWVSGNALGNYTDIIADSDMTAEPGQRIVADTGITITLPVTIEECGVTRPPKDFSTVIIGQDGETRHHLYEAPVGWTRVDGLTLESEAPFALRNRHGLAAVLAMVFAEQFGGMITPGTMRAAQQFKTSIAYRPHDNSVEYY